MKGVIDLTFAQMLVAYAFVIVTLIIARARGVEKEKTILIASARMTLQLIIAGYVLVYIFDNPSPALTIFSIVVMEIFSIHTILSRFKNGLSEEMKKVVVYSISFGTIVCLVFFVVLVVRVTPWFSPQYYIPIAGMIIGNSMTGIALGINALLEGINTNKNMVQESLILGATPKMAVRTIINKSFDNAILPTLNSMLGMGIVFLPGMMTGQILSGIEPTTAISYQIAIMLAILGAVAISVIILLQMGYKTFFNSDNQLRMID